MVGSGSEKLTVRKKAMGDSHLQAARRPRLSAITAALSSPHLDPSTATARSEK
jgi:hypothetical protein